MVAKTYFKNCNIYGFKFSIFSAYKNKCIYSNFCEYLIKGENEL